MHRPQTLAELMSAIRMRDYFASFIPRLSIIAAPLTTQWKKANTSLKGTPECHRAWEGFKEKLANAPIMCYPDYSQNMDMHPSRHRRETVDMS